MGRGKKWSKEEIQVLCTSIEEGKTHKEISSIINRTEKAINIKAHRLGFVSKNKTTKTTQEYKNQLPKDMLLIEPYISDRIKIMHKHSCGHTWKVKPNNILNGQGCPKCTSIAVKTIEKYVSELPKDIQLIGPYITGRIKTAHKHMPCGHIWDVRPSCILRGSGCPKCASHGFKPEEPAVLYLINFPSINIQKIGISNNYKVRIKSFGYPSEFIFILEFDKGKDALLLEKQLLNNIKNYKINTGLLNSGNTETFRFE